MRDFAFESVQNSEENKKASKRKKTINKYIKIQTNGKITKVIRQNGIKLIPDSANDEIPEK